jgi:hypothetical protein
MFFSLLKLAGDLEFSNDNGVTKALTVTGNTLKTLINSSPFLNTSATGVIQAGTILDTAAGGTGNANGTIAKTVVNSAPFLQTSGTGDIQAGTILATTAGGTGNANGTIAKTVVNSAAFLQTSGTGDIQAGTILPIASGGTGNSIGTIARLAGGSFGRVPYQSGVDTTTFSNAMNGAFQTFNGVPEFTTNISTVNIYSSAPNKDFIIEELYVGYVINIKSNSGDIFMSANNGTTRHLQVKANGTVSMGLAAYASSPFLTTDGAGVIAKGTVLPISAGGTGVSTITAPDVQQLTGSGTLTVVGSPKTIKVEIIGSGGGGGSGETNKGGGGGSGGSYAQTHFPWVPGNFTYVMSGGGAAGSLGVNGGNGGSSTFTSISPAYTMTVAGGGGGISATPSVPGDGGVAGLVTGFIGVGMFGEQGGEGTTNRGGDGGGACRGNGRISSVAHSGGGVYPGKDGVGFSVGGSGGYGNAASGGIGAAAMLIVTAYY